MLGPQKKFNALGCSQCIDPLCKVLRGLIFFLIFQKKNKPPFFKQKGSMHWEQPNALTQIWKIQIRINGLNLVDYDPSTFAPSLS